MAGHTSDTDAKGAKLGTTFHRSFRLKRSALIQVLALASKMDAARQDVQCLDREIIRQSTNLGTVYVEAVPRYGVGCGLLDQGYCLTRFGHATVVNDPLLVHSDTLWLMHYFLSTRYGPGPMFWHDLVASRFRTGEEFSASDISAQIINSHKRVTGKPLTSNSASTSTTVFLGTYCEDDGFGRLGILQCNDHHEYRVLQPEPPSSWALGYALLDFWQAQFGDRLTVNLDSLYGSGGLSEIFLIGAGRFNMLLYDLQAEGYIDVFRVAPPYQIVLLRQDGESLLRKIYEHSESL